MSRKWDQTWWCSLYSNLYSRQPFWPSHIRTVFYLWNCIISESVHKRVTTHANHSWKCMHSYEEYYSHNCNQPSAFTLQPSQLPLHFCLVNESIHKTVTAHESLLEYMLKSEDYHSHNSNLTLGLFTLWDHCIVLLGQLRHQTLSSSSITTVSPSLL